ncbi:MAG: transcriptional regulator, partial [Rudaea sp.]
MNKIGRTGNLLPANPMIDDGDELHFCSTCAFGSVCVPAGVDKSALNELHMLVEHVGPFRRDDILFRSGERFTAIFAVRAG